MEARMGQMTRGIPKLHRHEILNGSLLVARLACAVCLLFVADQANGESMKATGMEPQNGFAYHDISIGGPDMVDGLSERRQELHIYSNTGLEDDRRSTSIRTRICATPS